MCGLRQQSSRVVEGLGGGVEFRHPRHHHRHLHFPSSSGICGHRDGPIIVPFHPCSLFLVVRPIHPSLSNLCLLEIYSECLLSTEYPSTDDSTPGRTPYLPIDYLAVYLPVSLDTRLRLIGLSLCHPVRLSTSLRLPLPPPVVLSSLCLPVSLWPLLCPNIFSKPSS